MSPQEILDFVVRLVDSRLDDFTMGAQGDRGEQGPRGLTGMRGPLGLPGKMGRAGNDGRKGKDGLDGKKGDKGDTGPRGANGMGGGWGVLHPDLATHDTLGLATQAELDALTGAAMTQSQVLARTLGA